MIHDKYHDMDACSSKLTKITGKSDVSPPPKKNLKNKKFYIFFVVVFY